MTIDRRCGQCGREIEKAHRVYKGQPYCSTCYAREFKSIPCPRCGLIARLLAKDPDAICGRCEKDKPCVRCGKEKYSLGLMSIYGPVCKSCARYFSEPKPCSQCGQLSHHLSRVYRLGIMEPICPKCARQDHACCQACGRSRRLSPSPDGRQLCKKCLELGEIPCSSCGNLMPAGRGKQCNTCYWNSVFERRLSLNQTAILEKRISQNYYSFGIWLKQKIGSFNAALKIGSYLAFFLELEKIEFVNPDYSKLLAHFGAEQLRRDQLPIQWLIETQGLVVDIVQKRADSEKRQIDSLIHRFIAGSKRKKIIDAYYQYLVCKQENGKTSLRSIRLSLHPAVSVLELALVTGHDLPEQKDINLYINRTPGQNAALSGFISFLNKNYELQLKREIKLHDQQKDLTKERLEKKLIQMMMKPYEGEKFEINWIITSLAYFHCLSMTKAKKIYLAAFKKTSEIGISLELDRQTYWIPIWPVN